MFHKYADVWNRTCLAIAFFFFFCFEWKLTQLEGLGFSGDTLQNATTRETDFA